MDYGDDVGDLFVRFKHMECMEGEPTEDRRVNAHCDERGRIAAVEITNITIL